MERLAKGLSELRTEAQAQMRNDWSKLEMCRVRSGEFRSQTGNHFGAFVVSPKGKEMIGLRCIVDDGTDPYCPGWEHVSVSLQDRIPSWDEMEFIKQLFWDDEETVIQFHPKLSEYKNQHPYVLHLWRQVGINHPLPPSILV